MRTGVLAVLLALISITGYIFLQRDVADRLNSAMLNGLLLGTVLAILAAVVVIGVSLRKRYARGWRPRVSLIARTVIAISSLWGAGVILWGIVVDVPDLLSSAQYLALLLGPPFFFALAAVLGRWVYAALPTAK